MWYFGVGQTIRDVLFRKPDFVAAWVGRVNGGPVSATVPTSTELWHSGGVVAAPDRDGEGSALDAIYHDPCCYMSSRHFRDLNSRVAHVLTRTDGRGRLIGSAYGIGYDGAQLYKNKVHTTGVFALQCMQLLQPDLSKTSNHAVLAIVRGPSELRNFTPVMNVIVRELEKYGPDGEHAHACVRRWDSYYGGR